MVDAALSGAVEQRFVPLWLTTVFTPDVSRAFDELGVGQAERYFSQERVAPLGPASASVVVATFFNFSPAAVGSRSPGCGSASRRASCSTPSSTVCSASLDALSPGSTAMSWRRPRGCGRAAAAACERPEGRPLFAGYASLPWPDDPHLRLWHAHYLLREFRGDGHIPVLASEGLTRLEALELHIAFVPAVGPVFRATRGWSDDQWAASLETLQGRGWLTTDDELTLTPAGRRVPRGDRGPRGPRNVPAYEAVGDEGCARLLEVGAVIASALLADSGSPFPGLIPDG